MRTTVTIDDAQLAEARELSGIRETSALVRAAIAGLIQQEAARRLADMGGTMPDMQPIRRRRPWDEQG